MPTASDGKEFPYTKEGIKAHQEYEANLKKKKKKMGVPKSKPRTERTTGGSYT